MDASASFVIAQLALFVGNVRHSYSQRFASIRLSIVRLRQHALEVAAVCKLCILWSANLYI